MFGSLEGMTLGLLLIGFTNLSNRSQKHDLKLKGGSFIFLLGAPSFMGRDTSDYFFGSI